MTIDDRLTQLFSAALLFSCFLGIVVRHRVRVCISFDLYILAVFTSDLLTAVDPDRFYDETFWIFKEIVHAALKFAIALELSVRIFRRFPGASDRARRWLLAILFLTFCAVLLVPGRNADYLTLLSQFMPRVLNGTAWLFMAIAVLILWYRLPVDAFAKAIVLGFVPYLLIFNIGLSLIHSMGWGIRIVATRVPAVAYVILLFYWNYSAWSHAPASRTLPKTSPA